MHEKENKPVQIGELAKSLKITTRTIRYYEEIGLMGKTQRLGGGIDWDSPPDSLSIDGHSECEQPGALPLLPF